MPLHSTQNFLTVRAIYDDLFMPCRKLTLAVKWSYEQEFHSSLGNSKSKRIYLGSKS